MSTATDHRATEPLYDRIAAVYDQTRRLPAWVPDRLADEALRLCEPVRHLRLLEVGAGTGRIARGFLRPGLVSEYVGLDISPAMLAVFRRKAGERATTIVGDVTCTPFCDGEFHAVLSCHVLQMVTDLPAALAEIRRVLRPGGWYLHCTDELAPHQQELDQTWQRLLAEENPGYHLVKRYDMLRSEVIAHWARAAAHIQTVEIATWTTRHRVTDLLTAYQAKAYPSCHRVTDAGCERALARLRGHCHAAYGDLHHELSSTSRMELIAFQLPTAAIDEVSPP